MTQGQFHDIVRELIEEKQNTTKAELLDAYDLENIESNTAVNEFYKRKMKELRDAEMVNNRLEKMSMTSSPKKMRQGGYIDLSEVNANSINEPMTDGIPEVDVVKVADFSYDGPKIIKSSQDTVNVLRAFMDKEKIQFQEQMVIIYLDQKNEVQYIYFHTQGSRNAVTVDTTVIIGIALKLMSQGIIMCHNHPSGNLKPSNADKIITKKVKEAAAMFDIRFLDHIILTDKGYFSFADSTSILKRGGKLDEMVSDDMVMEDGYMARGGQAMTPEQRVQLMSDIEVIEALDQYMYYDRVDADMTMEEAYADNTQNRERLTEIYYEQGNEPMPKMKKGGMVRYGGQTKLNLS